MMNQIKPSAKKLFEVGREKQCHSRDEKYEGCHPPGSTKPFCHAYKRSLHLTFLLTHWVESQKLF
jgi:hypothetical protein